MKKTLLNVLVLAGALLLSSCSGANPTTSQEVTSTGSVETSSIVSSASSLETVSSTSSKVVSSEAKQETSYSALEATSSEAKQETSSSSVLEVSSSENNTTSSTSSHEELSTAPSEEVDPDEPNKDIMPSYDDMKAAYFGIDAYTITYQHFTDNENTYTYKSIKDGNYGHAKKVSADGEEESVFLNLEDLNNIYYYNDLYLGKYRQITLNGYGSNCVDPIPTEAFFAANDIYYTEKEDVTFESRNCTKYILEVNNKDGDYSSNHCETYVVDKETNMTLYYCSEQLDTLGDEVMNSSKDGFKIVSYTTSVSDEDKALLASEKEKIGCKVWDTEYMSSIGLKGTLAMPTEKWTSIGSMVYPDGSVYGYSVYFKLPDNCENAQKIAVNFGQAVYNAGANTNYGGDEIEYTPKTSNSGYTLYVSFGGYVRTAEHQYEVSISAYNTSSYENYLNFSIVINDPYIAE